MATEREANLAREQHSADLRKMGAHAIAVDEVKRKGAVTFAVIASFEKKPAEAPRTLEVKSGKRTVQVPLVVRVQEKFRLE
ncbi:MAG TPA: hypothetical protein VGQ36_26270 [Thermoanaerobaculia bacterium]|jgi:hypothetical protein|nr:hypothetical protein [Thermoanaerobaculia bacterium]